MPFIDWIEDDEASGELAEIYQAVLKTRPPDRPRMPGILKCFSQRPDFLRRVVQFSNELHFSDGHLDRRTKEMIATLVSALNQCPY
jgi:alkylhydroperoxidase family enzyme